MHIQFKSSVNYTHIYCNQQDIKNIFRRFQDKQEIFKKTLTQSHDKFYRKFIHTKRMNVKGVDYDK